MNHNLKCSGKQDTKVTNHHKIKNEKNPKFQINENLHTAKAQRMGLSYTGTSTLKTEFARTTSCKYMNEDILVMTHRNRYQPIVD